MINRHITFYVNEFKPLKFCGNVIGLVGDLNAFELPFEIEPTKGEHDFNKCKDCKKTLEKIKNILKSKFEGNGNEKPFPFCCIYHANLVKFKTFNRDSFINVPEMIAKKIIYTNQHIINYHSSKDWFKIITDYIEWMVDSFGQMPKGCGEPLYLGNYFNFLINLLKGNEVILTEKKNRILEYFNLYLKPNENSKIDLNILLFTYEKWLEVFPFELSNYFSDQKKQFEKQIPILNGIPEINIYSRKAKVNLHTKGSLIESLINLTNTLLIRNNGTNLYNKGLVSDIKKIQVDLIRT